MASPSEPGLEFRPYVPADQDIPEFTPKAILLGIFFGIVFGEDFDATPEMASSSLVASYLLGIFTLAGWIVFLSHLH